MKLKVTMLALMMAAAMVLVGCGETKTTETPAATSQVPTEAPTSTPTPEPEPVTSDFTMNEDNAKLIGRTYTSGTDLWLTYSGSGVEFTFTGTKCDITFKGDDNYSNANNRPRVAIYVNDKRVGDYLINDDLENYGPERTITAFESDTEETVTIKAVKLSEVCNSTVAIEKVTLTGQNNEPYPTAEKDLKIEFIGDSITCGYGIDGVVNVDTFKSGNEDCTKAYAVKTAALLDADYSLVCMSGHGIISGYTSNPAKASTGQLMKDFYLTLGNCYSGKIDGKKASELTWDFKRFQPDVVVLNLGTNDASYCKNGGDLSADEKKAYFESEYVYLLKMIRENNPDALICCILGTMGQDLCKNVENAVNAYTDETGDGNICYLKLPVQDTTNDGIAVDWHPTEATSNKTAETLSAFIRSKLEEN